MLAGADSNEVKAFVQNRLAQLQNKLGEKYAVNYLLFGSKVRQKKKRILRIEKLILMNS